MADLTAKKLALELAALERQGDLAGEQTLCVLEGALSVREPRLSLQAAKLIAAHGVRELEPALARAYREFAGAHASRDPGCLAKQALVAALDTLEHLDAELFAEAAGYVQLERLKGGPRDTAAGVRARGLLGVARLGHRDLLPILGVALADRDGNVRLSAARAAGHRGQRDAAGLLLLRLGVGDTDTEVASECLRALFALAPELAKRHAARALQGDDEQMRDWTLHALGTAPDDSAIELLAEELATRSLTQARAQVIEALGLSLRPRARALLLELVSGERTSDARAALGALAIHRYDGRLVEQLRGLTDRSRELAQRFRELFAD
jgi:HEAT repeat protein